eukprot:jgi/Tetstr1/420863/TSEL_011936.t1
MSPNAAAHVPVYQLSSVFEPGELASLRALAAGDGCHLESPEQLGGGEAAEGAAVAEDGRVSLGAGVLHGLLEQLDDMQRQVLEYVEHEKASEGLVAQLHSALEGAKAKLALAEGALSSAEIALRQEREARQKLEAQLAKEVADRKELATRVVEACVAGEGKLVGRRR